MHYKKILLILSIATLSLSGCKKSEPIDQPTTIAAIETTVAETTAAAETTPAPETTAAETNKKTTVVETTVAEETIIVEKDTTAESKPINEPELTPYEMELKKLKEELDAGLISQEDYDFIMESLGINYSTDEKALIDNEIAKLDEEFAKGGISQEEYETKKEMIMNTPMDVFEFETGDTHVDVPNNYGVPDETDWEEHDNSSIYDITPPEHLKGKW